MTCPGFELSRVANDLRKRDLYNGKNLDLEVRWATAGFDLGQVAHSEQLRGRYRAWLGVRDGIRNWLVTAA